ncbi:imidazole glycerol phosphate synthase subunit HisH [Clostridia bacterium]|nr:imidazole glycerol phosphate synthase subunit HisH [Clostridia bacterium]
MKVGVIDYGMGNLKSVCNALNFIGKEARLITSREHFADCGNLILPGVGAFSDALSFLREKEFDCEIEKAVREGRNLLGICLGLQILFDKSYENGEFDGLSLLRGEIVKFTNARKIPHMGWNTLNIKKKSPLFENLPCAGDPAVYFVHSYHLVTKEDIVSSTTEYGGEIQVSAQKDNLYAVQFHPEKSGEVGLKILSNFVSL